MRPTRLDRVVRKWLMERTQFELLWTQTKDFCIYKRLPSTVKGIWKSHLLIKLELEGKLNGLWPEATRKKPLTFMPLCQAPPTDICIIQLTITEACTAHILYLAVNSCTSISNSRSLPSFLKSSNFPQPLPLPPPTLSSLGDRDLQKSLS